MITLSVAHVTMAVAALSMKACQLLTAQDVQDVLGSGYRSQEMLENQVMSVCGYSKGGGNTVTLTLK